MTKLSDLKQGDYVTIDRGFRCREPGPALIRQDVSGALYIHCNEGLHYLHGQIDTEGELIGITKIIPDDNSKMVEPDDRP